MANLFNSGSSNNKKGVFLDTAKIIDITNSTTSMPKDIDIVLELEFNRKVKEGQSPETFTRKMFLSGNLFKNGDIPPFLTHFLLAIGIMKEPNFQSLVDDFSTSNITNKLKKFIIGKKIRTLQYVSGTYNVNGEEKPSYKFWNMSAVGFDYPNLFDINTDEKFVMEEFEKKCSDEKYPLRYTPEVLEENNNTGNTFDATDNDSNTTDDDLNFI